MNKYYTYESIDRWSPQAWAGRQALSDAIMDFLIPLVYQDLYRPASSADRFGNRNDGPFDAKTNTYTFPDVVSRWEKKGLRYLCTGMASAKWIAVVPDPVMDHTVSDPTILLVPHAADLASPHWAMNALEDLAAYHETALRTNTAMLYLVFGQPRSSGVYMDILLELSSIFRLPLDHLYLDLTHLVQNGKTLCDVPGLSPEMIERVSVIGSDDPAGDGADDAPTQAGRIIPVVEITGSWIARIGHQYICSQLNAHVEGFDRDRLVHSTAGHRIADSMFMEQLYDGPEDPALLEHWRRMGLRYETHLSSGEQWITFTPECAFDHPDQKIPILLIFKEVRRTAPFLTLTAFQFYYEFLEIAAQGECMLLFFAMETPRDNEQMLDLLREAADSYPADLTRVYLIGQSHNGLFALDTASRHPDVITAVAQLNDRHYINAPQYCMDNVKLDDDRIKELSRHDLPLINICGAVENVFPTRDPASAEFLHDAEGLNRRLAAFRCPQRDLSEIIAALHSPDKATRMNGIPADHTEVRYCMGTELYISDIKNIDGNDHLSLVSIENFPHMITPQMAELAWSFLRRFARDPRTGEITERY